MKKRFLITLAAFVLFAVAFGIYQSRHDDSAPAVISEIIVSPSSAGETNVALGTTSSSVPAQASSTNPKNTIINAKPTMIAQKGDIVFVQYTGKLTNGTVFDSSIPRGQPFSFQLGSGMVIAGWEKGILGMKVGEKKTLTIPPADGYGESGAPDGRGGYVIPPNSTLIFDVELVDIKR